MIFAGNHRAASAAAQELRPQAIHAGKLGNSISINFFSAGTTATPLSVIAADFNKDGKPDIAILDAAPRISILSGLGSYGFGLILPANSLPANPLSMAVGDFNGDGNLDLITVGFGKISVLLGNGDLAFKPPIVQTIVSTSFQKVAVGDFNKDGKLDIVITDMDASQTTIGVFMGNGDGTFSTSPIILNNSDSPEAVADGQTVNTTVTLTPIGNFAAPVTLACSGLPSLAQCSFNQPTYTLNRNVVTPVITISTVKGAAIATPPSKFTFRSLRQTPFSAASELFAVALILLASLSALPVGRGNRKFPMRGAAFCVILFGISLISSCGSAAPPSTPTGTTNITITATAAGTSGTITHQTTVSLTVTP